MMRIPISSKSSLVFARLFFKVVVHSKHLIEITCVLYNGYHDGIIVIPLQFVQNIVTSTGAPCLGANAGDTGRLPLAFRYEPLHALASDASLSLGYYEKLISPLWGGVSQKMTVGVGVGASAVHLSGPIPPNSEDNAA